MQQKADAPFGAHDALDPAAARAGKWAPTSHSWLPLAPRIEHRIGGSALALNADSSQAAKSPAARSAASASRTMPPLPIASRPSSNWGLKSATRSAPED